MKGQSFIQVACVSLLAIQQLAISVSAKRFLDGPNPFNFAARNSHNKPRNPITSSRVSITWSRQEESQRIRGGGIKKKSKDEKKIHLTAGQHQLMK